MDPAVRERFEEIALPHLDAVFGVARALTSRANDAEDLVQETFVRAFAAFDRFELREYGAKPWLLRILHNVYYSDYGRQKRCPTLLDDLDFDGFADELDSPVVDQVSISGINWEHFDQELKYAIDRLQPEYRSALLLWAIEGLNYKEIAKICDCAMGTVMSRLYRARQLLGRELAQYAQENNIGLERFTK